MKKNTSVLLVIKDNVEYKSLIELTPEINELTKGSKVTICSPICGSEKFRADATKVLYKIGRASCRERC